MAAMRIGDVLVVVQVANRKQLCLMSRRLPLEGAKLASRLQTRAHTAIICSFGYCSLDFVRH